MINKENAIQNISLIFITSLVGILFFIQLAVKVFDQKSPHSHNTIIYQRDYSLIKHEQKYCVSNEPGQHLIFHQNGIVSGLNPEDSNDILKQFLFESYAQYVLINDLLIINVLRYGPLIFKVTKNHNNEIYIASFFKYISPDSMDSILLPCN